MIDHYTKDDAIKLVTEEEELFQSFRDKTILITGATGLIGSHIVASLVAAKTNLKISMTILAMVRSEERAKLIFNDILDEVSLLIGDVNDTVNYDGKIDYIIHGASVTSSLDFIQKPVDTIFTAIDGTKHLLNLAKEKKVAGFIYLSSLEVYGNQLDKVNISETDYGYIDFTNVRSSYSEGKRMVECLSMAYASQYNIPVTIARLTQTFGPGVAYNDNRVFAQFARSAIEKKDIILHTTGQTMRSYCYTKDAVSAIFYILLKGTHQQAYNVANESSFISIKDLAQLVSKLSDEVISVEVDMKDTDKLGYNPEVKINLQTKKLKALGWKPTVNLEEMLQKLIGSMSLRKGSCNEY